MSELFTYSQSNIQQGMYTSRWKQLAFSLHYTICIICSTQGCVESLKFTYIHE